MRLPFLLFLLALLPTAAQAQREPPACTAARQGMVACFGEKLCTCRAEPGGSLTSRRAGLRWDCGALRPACGVAPAGPPPAELPQISIMPLVQPQQGAAPADPRLLPRSGAGAGPYGVR